MKMRVLLLIGLFSLLFAAEKKQSFKFTQQVQPAVVFNTDESAFEIARAIAGVQPQLKLNDITYSADFKLEFAGYDNLDKFVKTALVSAEIKPWMVISAGRVRVPFGENHTRASRKLDRISRSYTADYIKKRLSIGERSEGLLLSGDVNEYLSYESGIFNYSNNQRESNSLSSLAGNCFFTITTKPMALIEFAYSYSNFLVSGDDFHKRASAHDLFFSLKSTKHFAFKSEFFVGPDSAVAGELGSYLDGYKEHLAKSLFSTLTYTQPIDARSVSLTLFWERLWGKSFTAGTYEDRSFEHAYGANVRFRFDEFIYLDLEVEEKLDSDLKSLQSPEVALQFTFYNSVKR